jgi:hypothetical protein
MFVGRIQNGNSFLKKQNGLLTLVILLLVPLFQNCSPGFETAASPKNISGAYTGMIRTLDGKSIPLVAKINVDGAGANAQSHIVGAMQSPGGERRIFAAASKLNDGLTLAKSNAKNAVRAPQSNETVLKMSATSYLQLRQGRDSKTLIGDYYSSANSGKFMLVGSAKLAKTGK